MSMTKLLLIDGNSLINRAFFAIRNTPNNKGVCTNAIGGFVSSLLRLRKTYEPTHIAVAFDVRGGSFRNAIYDDYKCSRKGMPNELAEQLPHIKALLDSMGIARVELQGYEADDLIGTLAQCDCDHCYVATGDRDSFQLVRDSVTVCLATNKGEVCYTPDVIQNTYGIRPEQFVEVKALMGDKSDDIPGIPGVGEKTAFDLIRKYGSIENIYRDLAALDVSPKLREKLAAGRKNCYLSRQLGLIDTAAPICTSLEQYAIGETDIAALSELLTELEMRALSERLCAECMPKYEQVGLL